jgi:hypothetical protein
MIIAAFEQEAIFKLLTNIEIDAYGRDGIGQ